MFFKVRLIMKKIMFKYFVVSLLFFLNLSCDVPIGTLIKINTGTKPVEQFFISEKITSYSFKDGQFKDVAIESIAKYKSKDFVVIQTSSGMLCCGKEAKVFSVSKNKFIKSTDLDVTDILLSSELKQYPVEKVVNYESEEETFFVLSLEEPHAFFQCDSSGTSFLMHNNPAVFVLEYVIERGPEIIEIAASSVLALFGAKVAHDNGKHSHTFNEQRKVESRQRHIESLEDKVRFGKSTIEDQERLQLFTDFPGISDEEVDQKIEANRKYRESCMKNNENVIKVLGKDGCEQLIKYYLVTQQIQANNSANNINLNNDVSTQQEKQPPVIGDENDKSDDKESGKTDDKKSNENKKNLDREKQKNKDKVKQLQSDDDKLPNQGLVDSGKVLDAPPVDAGKQGKHVPGHNNCNPGKSQWPEGENGVELTQEAWMKGEETDKYDKTVRKYTKGDLEIKVHIDKKYKIHGYPNYPKK